MNLIVETDLGCDPDDFYAICYLISTGVNIRAITICPGDPDQIAFAKWLLKELDLDIPVGAGMKNRKKNTLSGLHRRFLQKYDMPFTASPDGYGANIIKDVFQKHPDSELFVIGPPKSVRVFLAQNKTVEINRATIQGGFIGYDVHGLPCRRLKKFEGRTTCQTFNLNGDVYGSKLILEANIGHRQFVSKNVNHTIIYNKEIHERIINVKPKNRAGEILRETLNMQVEKYGEKKFHDPMAAVCHLHPEIATWVKAKLYNIDKEWGATLDENGDDIIVDVDRKKFWEYIAESK
jgi:inosine-uridine nucleoside N-ribohydrolase